jgi:hypothetical protein
MSRRGKQASMRSIVAMFADDRQNRDWQDSNMQGADGETSIKKETDGRKILGDETSELEG